MKKTSLYENLKININLFNKINFYYIDQCVKFLLDKLI